MSADEQTNEKNIVHTYLYEPDTEITAFGSQKSYLDELKHLKERTFPDVLLI
jgi:hypothetical protein